MKVNIKVSGEKSLEDAFNHLTHTQGMLQKGYSCCKVQLAHLSADLEPARDQLTSPSSTFVLVFYVSTFYYAIADF
jgi:hypothetical protein